MPEAQRWVVVDSNLDLKRIIGGPYLWDGETQWTPPEDGELMLEADAQSQGFQWPPPPNQSYVQVDPNTMTITGGPYEWNGLDQPPPTEGSLVTEFEAQMQGYTWL